MLHANHLSEGCCYSDAGGKDMVAEQVLKNCIILFRQATVIENLNLLEEIYFGSRSSSEFPITKGSPYLDAFYIATCFENFLKMELIDYGYVIHIIDRRNDSKKYAVLASNQEKMPIKLSSLKKLEGLRWKRGNQFVFRSLTKNTINFNTLIKEPKYRSCFRMKSIIFQELNRIRNHRNNVHFLCNDVGEYNKQIVLGYIEMKKCINNRLIPKYNKLCAKLRRSQEWYVNKI